MHRITLPTTNERKFTVNPLQSKARYLVCCGPNAGFFVNMTYSINIDQQFAIANDLTLVQVSTLAAFMSLPIWSKTVAIDGYVWYQYSDEKMAEDFPLLFGVAKRCYKNITELCELGFVELTKLGRAKYVRFTTRCADWNKQKEQFRTDSPKTDEKQSENGPQNSPKTDRPNIDYNIKDYNIKTNDKPADGGLFPTDSGFVPMTVTHPRRTSEPTACLFENSRFADYEKFAAEFDAPEFKNVDILYYFHAVADWSAQKGKKMKDWIATARNFIRGDMEKGKLHRLNKGDGGLTPEAIEYLESMK